MQSLMSGPDPFVHNRSRFQRPPTCMHVARVIALSPSTRSWWDNLMRRGCPLLSIHEYPTLPDQKDLGLRGPPRSSRGVAQLPLHRDGHGFGGGRRWDRGQGVRRSSGTAQWSQKGEARRRRRNGEWRGMRGVWGHGGDRSGRESRHENQMTSADW